MGRFWGGVSYMHGIKVKVRGRTLRGCGAGGSRIRCRLWGRLSVCWMGTSWSFFVMFFEICGIQYGQEIALRINGAWGEGGYGIWTPGTKGRRAIHEVYMWSTFFT